MFEIKTINNLEELKLLFDFLSEVFWKEALDNNEHYYPMSDRYEEMKKQFENDKDFLMYIENSGEIIAGVTGKNIDIKNSKITMGILAVKKEYRGKGIAKKLVKEFENRCVNKNVFHIELGARKRAANLYNNLNYKCYLMVQVYDFVKIEDIRKVNKYNLKEKSCYQGDNYGFIIFNIPSINNQYIEYFEKEVMTSSVQFIFEKDL